MAKRSKSSPAKRARSAASAKPRHDNPIRRAAEVIEARFLEGAEQATDTSSAETNVVLAAIGAIEGPREASPKRKAKGSNGKRKAARSKKR